MKQINKIKKNLFKFLLTINKKGKKIIKKILLFIQRKPFTAFFLVLGIFLFLMIVGNVLFSPKPEAVQNTNLPKKVQIYKLGSAPEISYQGKVEKIGVVKIIAQSVGIVSDINVSEGDAVDAGTNILSLSTTYSGGNVPSISRQIAQDQYENIKETYNTQIDIIKNQRETADKNKENTDLLRQITSQSAVDTQAVADLDKTIVDGIEANIKSLEASNVNGSNDQQILGAKQSLAQFQGLLAQTNASFKNLQIQTNSNSSDTSGLAYQTALKQLDIQQKSLTTSLDIARLSYNIALINEAKMFPSSPFAGTVNKIFVHVGDDVKEGTVLANISGSNQHVKIVVNVPGDIAKNISSFESSTLYVGDKTITMLPTSISKDATNGTLYSVIYVLDDSLAPKLTDATYINVKIPVGVADTTNIDPFIPLDSVVQTQEEAFVYVADKNIVKIRKITLGQIQGRFVEVLSGLPNNSEVILNRNVIEGDKIQVIH
jgi:multidrug efflux pump subunit AcrA (membrane-fusion protein)